MTEAERQIGASRMRDCAERELRMRRRVYPKLVAEGRMTSREAADKLETMQAIAAHFTELVEPTLI